MSASSHAFLTEFFTDRQGVDGKGPLLPSSAPPMGSGGAARASAAVAAAKAAGHRAESALTEPFLRRLCRAHALETVSDLFVFLLTEERFVLRVAERKAGVGGEGIGASAPPPPPPLPRASGGGGGGGPAGVCGALRKRPRPGEVAVGSVFGEDDVFAALMADLSRRLLAQEGTSSPAALPSPSFPLAERAVRLSDASALAPSGATRFYSSGCDEVDRLLRGALPLSAATVTGGSRTEPSSPSVPVLGGFCSHQLTEVSGEAGTGKTLLTLQAAFTYITRKLAADAVCRFFGALDSEDDERARAGEGMGEPAALLRRRPHLLQPCWPSVQALLRWLHNGEEGLFPSSSPLSLSSSGGATTAMKEERESIADALRKLPRRASPICCLYLVSEDMPSARLSSLAAGAAKALLHTLADFFAPRLPGDVLNRFVRAMRTALTLEATLHELKVRPFGSLEELLQLLEMPSSADRQRPGQLIDMIANLQQRRVPAARGGAASESRGGGGGLVVFDSIAAAAMQSSEGLRERAEGGAHRRGAGGARVARQALLERVGVRLRAMASRFALCVLVTNQVRGRVDRRDSATGGDPRTAGGAVDVVDQPLLRLKRLHGFIERPPGRRHGGDGSAAAEADPVPALGLPWAVFPHSHVFLRRARSAAVRELVLVASPAVGPFSLTYTITTDGMRPLLDG